MPIAVPHAPAPRTAILTPLLPPDLIDLDVARLAVAVPHVHPAGGGVEEIQYHFLLRLEDKRGGVLGALAHLRERHLDHDRAAVGKVLVLDPGELAAGI